MIDPSKLDKEDIKVLTQYFLENSIIKFKDILSPIEEYFWKLDLNAETQSFELFLGIPKDWLYDMTMGSYIIKLVNENDNGKIIKLVNSSEEFAADFDELLLFAMDIIQRNNAILAKIREKEYELKSMKEKMVEIQMALDKEIEILKTIKIETIGVEDSIVEDEKNIDEPESQKVIQVIEEQKTGISTNDYEKLHELIGNK